MFLLKMKDLFLLFTLFKWNNVNRAMNDMLLLLSINAWHCLASKSMQKHDERIIKIVLRSLFVFSMSE